MKHIQAAKHGGTQRSVDRIVIHGTVSPCVRGGAVNVARYFQTKNAGGSAHYNVDPGEIVRCLAEDVVAWHAPPNPGSIGIELCDPQKGPSSRWRDADHEAMLRLAATLVRQVAKRWNIPLRKLTVAEVRAGKRGICGHVDVSKAFGQSDHTDPGTGFPWDHFMQLVLGKGEPSVPAPPAAGQPPDWPGRVLRNISPMMHGTDVRTWQTAARRFAPGLDADGWYGPASEAVCKDIQRTVGVPVTGTVTGETWLLTHIWEPERKENTL